MRQLLVCLFALFPVLYFYSDVPTLLLYWQNRHDAVTAYLAAHDASPLCPQVPQLLPKLRRGLWEVLERRLSTQHFANRTAELLAGAVRIPCVCSVPSFTSRRSMLTRVSLAEPMTDRTEVYDVMDPVGEDPRWDVFSDLHDYLLQAFPLTYANVLLLAVNSYDNAK